MRISAETECEGDRELKGEVCGSHTSDSIDSLLSFRVSRVERDTCTKMRSSRRSTRSFTACRTAVLTVLLLLSRDSSASTIYTQKCACLSGFSFSYNFFYIFIFVFEMTQQNYRQICRPQTQDVFSRSSMSIVWC